MEFSAEMLAGALGGEIVGDRNATVSTFAKIEEGHKGALSFLANPKYEHYIYETASSIVIVNKSFEPQEAVKATMIKVDDAYSSFAKLLELYASNKPQKKGISAKAEIDPSATIGEGCYIGAFTVIDTGAKIGNNTKIYPHCYIGDGAKIGSNVTLNAGVTIYEGCVIGDNVIIHAGTVVGSDGFGFAPTESGVYSKIPQIGNVVIEDDVEIGANTCLDRATMGSTIIHKGVKLDNLIQIAHNVTIGENTVMAAQNGVAGSTKVGRSCMFAGQVGISGHITIGDRVQLGSQTGVSKSIPADTVCLGFPALPVSQYHRCNAVFRHLPELSQTVYSMEKQVKELFAAKETGK